MRTPEEVREDKLCASRAMVSMDGWRILIWFGCKEIFDECGDKPHQKKNREE
jgi:hypothetical protein